MSPLVISSRPAMSRRPVDLPQPDGPTRTRNSLSWTWIDRSLTAVTSPNFLLTWSSNTPAMRLLPSKSLLLALLRAEHNKSEVGCLLFRSVRARPARPGSDEIDRAVQANGGVDQQVRSRHG